MLPSEFNLLFSARRVGSMPLARAACRGVVRLAHFPWGRGQDRLVGGDKPPIQGSFPRGVFREWRSGRAR